MLRRITLVAVFGFLFSFSSKEAFAQDCDAASLSNDLADFSAEMESAESVSSVLDDVEAWLSEQQSACDSNAQSSQTVTEPGPPKEPTLSFSSAQDGNQPVLGPLKIEDGIYRIRLETDGFFIADLEEMEGKCELLTTFGFFNISMGQAENGAEVVLVAEGCEALISISNVTTAWTLDFYAYGPEDVAPVKTEYSSETDGTMPVLGPLQFEDGRYKITLKTEGFFIASLETVDGNCESNSLFGLYNISAGQASQGAQTLITTQDCIALITTTNINAPWTLTFEPLQ